MTVPRSMTGQRAFVYLLVPLCSLVTLDDRVSPRADGNGNARADTLVFTSAVQGRGTMRLYASERRKRVCLRLVRRFREAGRSRSDSWTSCGLPRATQGIRVRNRVACRPGEMQHMGVTPAETDRLRGRLGGGGRVRIPIHAAPPAVGGTSKVFAHVVRRGELVRLRAFDRRGRELDDVAVAQFRGPWPCEE